MKWNAKARAHAHAMGEQLPMRESDGDPDCDHDFEVGPNVQQASFAIWNCTVCGRAFRFDVWN
jgi:hypothetical protein